MIGALDEIALERGYPARITVANGPEFRGRALAAWAYEHRVTLEFIDPGKPIQNDVRESDNGRRRDELLNLRGWQTVGEARDGINAQRQDYHEVRPHRALGNRTPIEFARGLSDRDPGVAVA